MPIQQFTVGRVYTFNTYAPEVLGLTQINVKCVAITNAQNALSDGIDIKSMHERIRPHLPAGYNNDPLTMTYVKLRNVSGLETIYSMDWINMATVKETSPRRIVATINGVSEADVNTIREALVIQGYTDIQLSLTD